MSGDPYCYLGTNVLRNLLGIRDEDEWKATESRVAILSLFPLQDQPLAGEFDEKRLKATHYAIFVRLYEWAGTYRQHVGTMTKGRTSGYTVTYGDSAFVPGEMKRIFAELAAEHYLRGLKKDAFSARLAYFYSEIDATHPFREGNSRTLRQFTTDLALAAGYELGWGRVGATEDSRNSLYTARDLALTRGDRTLLEKILSDSLRPLLRDQPHP